MTGRTNITDEEASTTFADLAFLLSHSCPVIRDNVSRFLDTGSPEGKHFFVRPFLIAGKIPVAGIVADALGRHGMQLGHIDGRFALWEENHRSQPSPGKILHPRSVGRDGIDLLHFGPAFLKQNEQEYFRS